MENVFNTFFVNSYVYFSGSGKGVEGWSLTETYASPLDVTMSL